MQQHLTVKELIATTYEAASDLPPASARLMRDVASRLDVTFIALTESLDIRTGLAAEVKKLRSNERGDHTTKHYRYHSSRGCSVGEKMAINTADIKAGTRGCDLFRRRRGR